ncbi:MAG: PilZ domain-containing protein [Myxococcaceae bacterium]
MVAHGSVGAAFLDDIDRHAPGAVRVLLSSGEGLDSLIDAMGDGHRFIALPDSTDPSVLLPQLETLLFPRASLRRAPEAELHLAYSLQGHSPARAPVLDVSSRGLAFVAEANDELEHLLPGSRLRGLSVWRGEVQVITDVEAVVRHLIPLDDRGTYRVGVELVSGHERDSETPSELVRDPVRISALLKRALHRGVLQLHPDGAPEQVVTFQGGSVNAHSGSVSLAGATPPGLEAGDVVHGSFELGGSSFAFASGCASVASDSITLKVPRSLRAFRRRQSSRFRPPEARRIEVELESPFGRNSVRRQVLDVNASGLAFMVDPTREVFPVGTLLENLVLHFPDGAHVEVRGRVRSHSPNAPAAGDDRRLTKCGVEFEGISLGQRVRIAHSILHAGLPGVEDAFGLPFGRIWDLLEESGFLYPEKLKKLEPVLPEIQKTLSTLLSRPNRLFKTFIYTQDQSIQGHLSTFRAYRNTWVVQHLATRREGPGRLAAARMLNVGTVEYLEQIPEMEWLKIYLRPNNKYPARVFGGFARRIADSSISDLRTYSYLVARAEPGAPIADGNLQIRLGEPSDAAAIEAWFVARGRTVALRADDLCRSGLWLPELAKEYRALDLVRRREVLIAERSGRRVGFAIAEISSPGLNFSDLTNSFRIHLEEPDPAARRALAASAKALYADLGRQYCIALEEGPDLSDFEAVGFQKSKEYTCWTWNRSLFRAYHEYILRLYDRTGGRARA